MLTTVRNLAKASMVFIILSLATLAQASQYANLNSGAQPATVSQQPNSPQGSYFDHVLVIMLENEGISDICGGNPPPCKGANTPYLSSLANSNGISQQYLSLIGTSQPNYIGILGGSIFTCTRTFGTCPAAGSIKSPNLVDRLEASGLTWKAYMESQNVAAGCDTTNQAPYEYTHNGFVEFQDITNNTARCNKIVLANPALNSTCTVSDCALIKDLNSTSAPSFMWLTPNDCDNLHGASICTNGCSSAGTTCMAAGDKYLQTLVTNVLSSDTFQKQKSALFITFDEGGGYCPLNNTSEDCLYAVWAGPAAKTSFVSSHLYNMYSLTKTIETNWNLTSLASNDANATPMTEFLIKSTALPPQPPPGLYFDHVVVVMMEDHGIQEICNVSPPPCSSNMGAPYMANLANSYAIGSQYLGVSHFSQADYLAMLGGSVENCSSAGCPWPFSATNLVDRFEAASLTWKGYIENQNLARGCDTIYHQPYTPEHNPFVGFTDIVDNATRCNNVVLANPSGCSVTDCPLISDLNSGSAPNFMWVTPNNCDNMHGYTYPNGTVLCPTSVSMGDSYLSGLVPNILNSQAFTSQRSALFVVFDEGNGYCPLNQSTTEDCVYAVLAGPLAKTNFGTTNLYNHYSVTKTIEANWNLTSLTSNDANATPMTEFFKPPPDFGVEASSPQAVNVGQQVTSTVTITPMNGFVGTVSLGEAIPSGLTCGAVTPRNVTNSGNATITCTSNSAGNYTLTVTGSNGKLTHAATAVFRFQDFTMTPSSPSSTSPGLPSNSTIAVTANNQFAGVVVFSDKVANGLTCSITPANITGPGVAVLSCSASSGGSYAVNITGTSGSLSHTASVVFTVSQPDFALTADPISLTANANSNASSTITVAPKGGFTGTITLTLSISPAGLTCSLTPTGIILGPSQTTTLSCSGTSGAYTVLVSGTNGSLTRSTVVAVNMADFTISANPSTISFYLGSGTSTTAIAVSSINGFNGIVSLSANVSPSTGLVCTLSPTIMTGSGTSTLSCKPSATGSFNVTVTGVSGSLSHSTALSITVLVQPTALIVGYDGSVFNHYLNGTNSLVGKPVGSALRQVAWKPDGSYAVIVGDKGVILTYNGILLTKFSSPLLGSTNLETVAWKPDGSYALIAGQNGLIFSFNGTTVAKVTDPSTRNIWSISWNPGGSSALLVGDGGSALLYSLSGKVTVLTTGTGQPLFAVTWSPTGTYALAAGGNGVVLRYNGTKFTVVTLGGGPAGHNMRSIAFNPTGSLAMLVGDGGQILTYNGTRLMIITSGTNQNLYSVAWFGSTAYVVGQNGTLISYTSGTLKKLVSGTNVNLGSIAWKPA